MIDRIKQVMEYSGLTPAQFSTELGINRSNLTHLFSGRNQPSLDFIRKILIKFPQIKTEWLMMGMGSMLKQDNNFTQPTLPQFESNEPDLFSQLEPVKQNKVVSSQVSIRDIEENKNSEPLEKSGENKNIKQEKKQRESIFASDHKVMDQIFNSPEDKKIKKIVLLYMDNTFEVYNPQN
jgi:transcriptional regulator with XRE-family HTH domain